MPKIVNKGKTTLIIVSLLALTGCHRDFTLFDTNGTVVGKGSLETSANFPSPVHASVNGKNFSGVWKTTKVYEDNIAKLLRDRGSRADAEYIQGNSSRQLWHGHAALSTQDGVTMECEFYYRIQPQSGNCSIDGNRLTVKFTDGIH